jgi:chromosome segregation protein
MLNDADVLEVSRKIISGEGSHYRINGREVRARDVQLLFADAATGARSSALVRQGQIAELIAAKPQARRMVLEDAAGIAGLYTRRREAELRLKATDENLLRVEDVLNEIDQQIKRLDKQAEQAKQYRHISAQIREHEALLLALAWIKIRDQVISCEQDVTQATIKLAEATTHQAKTAQDEAIAAHSLDPLRVNEQHKADTLQKVKAALTLLEAEERRAQERTQELTRRISDATRDQDRDNAALRDAQTTLAKLRHDENALSDKHTPQADEQRLLEDAHTQSSRELEAAEQALQTLQQHSAKRDAERQAVLKALTLEQNRLNDIKREQNENQQQREALMRTTQAQNDYETLSENLKNAQELLEHLEREANEKRHALQNTREREHQTRTPLTEAEKQVQRFETELKTLQKLFAPRQGERWPKILDSLSVEKGYEIALGAVFGDDLDAALDSSAPLHWRTLHVSEDDLALPQGAMPLLNVTKAPPALTRALKNIGVVTRERGETLHQALKAGQTLVSKEGDVWRWDGLMARAEAPSGAAKRLAEKNRLHTLESQLLEAHKVRHLHQSALENLQNEIRTLTRDEADAFQALQSAQKQRENARNAFTQFEREQAGISSRILHLNETAQRLEKSITQSEQRLFELQNDLTQLETSADDETKLHDARLNVANARDLASQTRTQLQAFIHDQTQKRARRDALQRDISAWQNRFENAQQAVESWHTRLTALEAEQATLLEAPQTFLITRRTLLSDITEAEQARRKAADKLNAAQLAQAHHQREAKNALETLSQAREAKITADVRFEAAMSKREDMIAHIDEALKITPAALLIQTQKMLQDTKPVPATLETQLNRLKREREEMGGVNLRAEEELNESQLKKDQLVQERDDLIEAIRRLRGGIGNLNREGRERLLAAFETVNNHFGTLFTHLFGGGSAHLKLIESDDPLEAGLEIIAHPPGKKPQILTLLSGGEQALTATALIFAVFLTNPSPICVLDEVDAPLDDANVARYCDLLDDMVSRTDTRFLVITHNPITMSRMNRLYGVTMMERGVSMVLSVNLDQAQDMAEAG